MKTHRASFAALAPRTRVAKRTLAVSVVALAVASCKDVPPTYPTGETFSVCHSTGATGELIQLHASEFTEHQAHGDYVAHLIVGAGTAGDGIHFARITDALAAVRAGRLTRNEAQTAKCRITIAVAPGTFTGSFRDTVAAGAENLPLVIDVPDVTLIGSFVMQTDDLDRATGTNGNLAGTTTIEARPGLVSIKTGNALDKYAEPLIIVSGRIDGPRGNNAVVEGFIMKSGNDAVGAVVGGNAVWAMRVTGLLVRGNQIEGGFSEPVEMRSSIGRIEHNLLLGRGGSCALCLFGPGDYHVVGNRQTGLTGRLAVLVFPTIFTAVPPGVEQIVLGTVASVTATVTNNDFRDHQEVPFGIGLRVAAVGPGAPEVIGNSRLTAENNDLSNNRFGVVAEAGFVVANTGQRGSIDLALHGNTLTGSCEVGLLVALNGQSAAMGIGSGLPTKNSTYTVALGGDIAWSDVWYSNPAGTGNTLMVDGLMIPAGSKAAYDPKAC